MIPPEAAAGMTWAITYGARALGAPLWRQIPDRWRWLVPLGIAGSVSGVEAWRAGASPQDAAALALWAFLGAMGGHRLARDLPGPYR